MPIAVSAAIRVLRAAMGWPQDAVAGWDGWRVALATDGDARLTLAEGASVVGGGSRQPHR
jgi:hypothetical protein